MRACVLHEIKQPLQIEERSNLQPGEGEVVVRLKAASLNRRDYWITQDLYPGIELPCVLGSDGVGVVSSVGANVEERWLGQEVILDAGMDWGDDEAAQAAEFSVLGMPVDGTFADEVVVRADQLHPKPAHLDWASAATLPVAGVTAYRAIFRQGQLKEGETILITGVGGGVAAFALQFAVAAGAKVWVTSSSEEKIRKAVELGALGGFDYREESWAKQFVAEAGAPHLILDSAGGSSYAQLVKIAAPGGRIVNCGSTTGAPDGLDLFKVFWKQLHLVGSSLGSPVDFTNMLEFVGHHKIEPLVDATYPLVEVNTALESMKNSPQFGKIVLTT
ncbi:MAG: zinc-binding dehydrogenase [Verrucomicrobiota bacterium]